MGAVLARASVVDPLVADGGRVFRHGITFGGHPVSAAIALKNIEIFERDQVLQNVRALAPHLQSRMEELRSPADRRRRPWRRVLLGSRDGLRRRQHPARPGAARPADPRLPAASGSARPA